MRIRQPPSGPFVGRSVNCTGVRWAPTVPPLETVTVPGPVEIPSLEFTCNAAPGEVIQVSPLFWNISWTLAATITLELKVRKPDGTLTDFTNPQAVVFTLPFPAPGQEFIPISAVEYTVTDSGSHAVVCLAGITAGVLTLIPPTSYGVLVL